MAQNLCTQSRNRLEKGGKFSGEKMQKLFPVPSSLFPTLTKRLIQQALGKVRSCTWAFVLVQDLSKRKLYNGLLPWLAASARSQTFETTTNRASMKVFSDKVHE